MASATVCLRRHDPSFGSHLRELREAAGLSLRDAASVAGMSFAKLQKMETGGRFRVTSPALLDGLADLYRVDRAELWRLAGFVKVDVSSVVDAGDPDGGASAGELAHARGYQLGWDAAVAALLAAAKGIAQAAAFGGAGLPAVVATASEHEATEGDDERGRLPGRHRRFRPAAEEPDQRAARRGGR
jgi:transcriptional regulator with XRE-family HTH domain